MRRCDNLVLIDIEKIQKSEYWYSLPKIGTDTAEMSPRKFGHFVEKSELNTVPYYTPKVKRGPAFTRSRGSWSCLHRALKQGSLKESKERRHIITEKASDALQITAMLSNTLGQDKTRERMKETEKGFEQLAVWLLLFVEEDQGLEFFDRAFVLIV